MKTPILFALFVTTFIAGEIQWTPRLTSVPAGDGTVQRVQFTDGERTYSLSPDGQTRIEATDNGARVTFRRTPSAILEIRPPARRLPLPGGAAQLTELRVAAHALAPAGHGEITDTGEFADVLAVNGWKSHRFHFDYSHHAIRLSHSVTFLTFESGQQVVLSTTVHPKDLTEALALADRLLRTWHEVEKGAPAGS